MWVASLSDAGVGPTGAPDVAQPPKIALSRAAIGRWRDGERDMGWSGRDFYTISGPRKPAPGTPRRGGRSSGHQAAVGERTTRRLVVDAEEKGRGMGGVAGLAADGENRGDAAHPPSLLLCVDNQPAGGP